MFPEQLPGRQPKATKKHSKYDPYFIRTGSEKAQCKICPNTFVSWTSKGGTNSVRCHLANRHPELMNKLNLEDPAPKRQRPGSHTSPQTFDPTEDYFQPPDVYDYTQLSEFPIKIESPEYIEPSGSHQSRQIIPESDRAVISMIFEDHLPISMLNGPGFNKFMRFVAPHFEVKPLDYYSQNTVPQMVFNIQDEIRFELKNANKLTISLDTYTPESLSGNLVAAVYVYYTNIETMTPRKLLVRYDTKNENSFDWDALLNYTKNLVGITMKEVTVLFHSDFMAEPSNGSLPSFDDILSNIAYESFKNCHDLIDKQKTLLLNLNKMYNTNQSSLSISPFFGTKLTEELLKSSERLTWKSHKEILSKLLETSLSYEYETVSNQSATLTPNEKEASKIMLSVLEEIETTKSSIQHQFYETASVIIPTLRVLCCKMEDLSAKYRTDENNFILHTVVATTRSMFLKCQANMILKTATFLDPRFRGQYFEDSHQEYMEKTYHQLANTISNESFKEENDEKSMSSFDLFVKSRKSQASTPSFTKELEEYQNEQPNSKTDPRDFWIANETRFPTLKTLANDFLSIPASASGAKELFEKGQKMCPLVAGNENLHDSLVFCGAKFEEFGMF